MEAITSAVLAVMHRWGWSADCSIVIGNEMYCDTPRAIKQMSAFFTKGAIPVHKAAVHSSDKLVALFERNCSGRNVLFLLEPCTNPKSKVFDWSVAESLRAIANELVIVADTTWTPEFNPLQYGADAVVMSLTKHHSISQCILGAVIGSLAKNVIDYRRMIGAHVSPANCKIVAANMVGMSERIDQAHRTAAAVAQGMKLLPNIKEVRFPTDPTHTSYELASKYRLRPTAIAFLVSIPCGVEQWLRSRKGIEYATSFGGREARLDPWPRQAGGNDYWCRLSLGYRSEVDAVLGALHHTSQ